MNDDYQKPLSGLMAIIIGLMMLTALIHVAISGGLFFVGVTCFGIMVVGIARHFNTGKGTRYCQQISDASQPLSLADVRETVTS